MIYLVCAQSSKQEAIEIIKDDHFKEDVFFKYIVDTYAHKNILYSLDFYNNILKEIIPNRVNVIYTKKNFKVLPNIVNGIVSNNIREIIKAYKNNIDDVYILATETWLIEEFSNYADFVIVFIDENHTKSSQILPDLINFSNYNLLKIEEVENKKLRIEYYVSNKKVGKK